MREAGPEETIQKAEFVYRSTFMSMEHNYLCAVCKENVGVQDCNSGILQPCWDCMKMGYALRKHVPWYKRLFGRTHALAIVESKDER